MAIYQTIGLGIQVYLASTRGRCRGGDVSYNYSHFNSGIKHVLGAVYVSPQFGDSISYTFEFLTFRRIHK
ncbi:MAG: hypothetical protein ACRCVT_01425 [Leadbetterella sp.]